MSSLGHCGDTQFDHLMSAQPFIAVAYSKLSKKDALAYVRNSGITQLCRGPVIDANFCFRFLIESDARAFAADAERRFNVSTDVDYDKDISGWVAYIARITSEPTNMPAELKTMAFWNGALAGAVD
jgi:hypothetical protein